MVAAPVALGQREERRFERRDDRREFARRDPGADEPGDQVVERVDGPAYEQGVGIEVLMQVVGGEQT